MATYQVYAHPEASFCLEFAYLSTICEVVPYVDSPIKRRSSKVLSVLRKSYRPYFSCFVAIYPDSAIHSLEMSQLCRRENRTHNHGRFTPPPTISCCPNFGLTPETHASGYLSITACNSVMAAQSVSIVESLKERKVGLVGGIDFNGRRAGRGEDLS